MAEELSDFEDLLGGGGSPEGGDNATARLEELKVALEHFQSNTDVFFLITMGTIVFCKYSSGVISFPSPPVYGQCVASGLVSYASPAPLRLWGLNELRSCEKQERNIWSANKGTLYVIVNDIEWRFDVRPKVIEFEECITYELCN